MKNLNRNLLHTITGSNQYKRKRRLMGLKLGTWWLIINIGLILGIISVTWDLFDMWLAEQRPPISPLSIYSTGTTAYTSTTSVEKVLDTKGYIYTIFGQDAPIALSIALAESHLTEDAVLKSDYENSIGIFQINLENATAKVHYDRVPGETLDDKIEWLKNPKNNTLMAYWIYTKSGWYPWSTYTNGAYQKYL